MSLKSKQKLSDRNMVQNDKTNVTFILSVVLHIFFQVSGTRFVVAIQFELLKTLLILF